LSAHTARSQAAGGGLPKQCQDTQSRCPPSWGERASPELLGGCCPIAELDLESLAQASHRDHSPDEPGEHHRQEVAHQREDEKHDLGDDNQTHDLDCAAYGPASRAWEERLPSSHRGLDRSSWRQLSCSSSPELDLEESSRSHSPKPEQGRGLGEVRWWAMLDELGTA